MEKGGVERVGEGWEKERGGGWMGGRGLITGWGGRGGEGDERRAGR